MKVFFRRGGPAVAKLLLGLCVVTVCEGAAESVQPQLLSSYYRGVMRERLRGGWSHPLMPDVLSHPLPDLEPLGDLNARRVMVRSSSRASLHAPAVSWISKLVPGRGSRRLAGAEQVEAGERRRTTTAADGESVCQDIMIEASVEECFSSATGFEQYPKWAGGIQGLTILEREAKSGIGTLVDWDMGLFGISTRNTMRYKYEMPKAGRAVMDWHVTEGGVRKLVGRYEFVAVGPSQTKVVYNLLVEPGFPLPDMIKRATQRTIARSALQELKRYTERQRQSSEATEATALLAAAAPQRVSRCGHTAAPPGDERPLASLHVEECVFSSPLFSH